MATIIIDYKKIVTALEFQFRTIYSELSHTASPEIKEEISKVKGWEFSDEQSFLKKQQNSQLQKGFIYFVVKFGAGSSNYGSSVSPITIMAMGVANCIKPTQLLMSVFAATWTTKNMQDSAQSIMESHLQVWNTPEVVSNFNETNTEFRSLFKLTGNIVVGPSAVRLGTITYVYNEESYDSEPQEGINYETVAIMSFQDNYGVSLDSQPFGNTNGFAVSEVNFSTYTFTFSTYLLDNQISADILAVRGFRNRSGSGKTSSFKPNQRMKMKLEFTNGFNNFPAENETSLTDPVMGNDLFSYYKVAGSQISQEIANMPMLTISLTRCRKEI